MGGYSGSAVAAHTLLVWMGDNAFAVSKAQHKLLSEALKQGGAIYVSGPQARTARALSLFGDIEDNGDLKLHGRVDGERWVFTVREGVRVK